MILFLEYTYGRKKVVHILNDLMKIDDILGCMFIDKKLNCMLPSSDKVDLGAKKSFK